MILIQHHLNIRITISYKQQTISPKYPNELMNKFNINQKNFLSEVVYQLNIDILYNNKIQKIYKGELQRT